MSGLKNLFSIYVLFKVFHIFEVQDCFTVTALSITILRNGSIWFIERKIQVYCDNIVKNAEMGHTHFEIY